VLFVGDIGHKRERRIPNPPLRDPNTGLLKTLIRVPWNQIDADQNYLRGAILMIIYSHDWIISDRI